MLIRPVREADISQITAIYAQSVVEDVASFELEPPSQDEMHRRMQAITEAGYPYLVAEIDGAIAGYTYASAFRPREAYRMTVENTVYVAPQFQRRGVGKALLLALIEACQLRGFKQMIGGIGGTHNTASIRLHEACGFQQAGHFRNVGFKHDEWLDVIFLQRAL